MKKIAIFLFLLLSSFFYTGFQPLNAFDIVSNATSQQTYGINPPGFSFGAYCPGWGRLTVYSSYSGVSLYSADYGHYDCFSTIKEHNILKLSQHYYYFYTGDLNIGAIYSGVYSTLTNSVIISNNNSFFYIGDNRFIFIEGSNLVFKENQNGVLTTIQTISQPSGFTAPDIFNYGFPVKTGTKLFYTTSGKSNLLDYQNMIYSSESDVNKKTFSLGDYIFTSTINSPYIYKMGLYNNGNLSSSIQTYNSTTSIKSVTTFENPNYYFKSANNQIYKYDINCDNLNYSSCRVDFGDNKFYCTNSSGIKDPRNIQCNKEYTPPNLVCTTQTLNFKYPAGYNLKQDFIQDYDNTLGQSTGIGKDEYDTYYFYNGGDTYVFNSYNLELSGNTSYSTNRENIKNILSGSGLTISTFGSVSSPIQHTDFQGFKLHYTSGIQYFRIDSPDDYYFYLYTKDENGKLSKINQKYYTNKNYYYEKTKPKDIYIGFEIGFTSKDYKITDVSWGPLNFQYQESQVCVNQDTGKTTVNGNETTQERLDELQDKILMETETPTNEQNNLFDIIKGKISGTDSKISEDIQKKIFGENFKFFQDVLALFNVFLPSEPDLTGTIPTPKLTSSFGITTQNKDFTLTEIEDNLGVNQIEESTAGKKFLAFILALIYILFRIMVISLFLSIFIIFWLVISKVVSIVLGPDFKKNDSPSNGAGLLFFSVFSIAYLAFFVLLFGKVLPITDFISVVVDYGNLFFSFTSVTLSSYDFFSGTVNLFFSAFASVTLAYMSWILWLKFGRIN